MFRIINTYKHTSISLYFSGNECMNVRIVITPASILPHLTTLIHPLHTMKAPPYNIIVLLNTARDHPPHSTSPYTLSSYNPTLHTDVRRVVYHTPIRACFPVDVRKVVSLTHQ